MQVPRNTAFGLIYLVIAAVLSLLFLYGPFVKAPNASEQVGHVLNDSTSNSTTAGTTATPTITKPYTRARFLVAIIAGPGEEDARNALRETVLKPRAPVVKERPVRDGTPGKTEIITEVEFVYRFFVATNEGFGKVELAWLQQSKGMHGSTHEEVGVSQQRRKEELPKLAREMQVHDDIISLPFFDHKNNLAYKRLLAFEWVPALFFFQNRTSPFFLAPFAVLEPDPGRRVRFLPHDGHGHVRPL